MSFTIALYHNDLRYLLSSYLPALDIDSPSPQQYLYDWFIDARFGCMHVSLYVTGKCYELHCGMIDRTAWPRKCGDPLTSTNGYCFRCGAHCDKEVQHKVEPVAFLH